ncbi:LGFP repeat-containing protein [Microbacterium sp.]|uniref:LGFP repeat-containing protein n=1 Tax=Microbacterium sp. TaxID=51671 RepID=UPI00356408F2
MPRILATVVAVAALVVGVAVPASSASAASPASSAASAVSSGPVQAREVKTTLAGFSAGNIISDAVFTKKNSMTQAQIQTFFNSKVSKCQSGYVCLKDFKITSVTRPADAYCDGYTGAANETAARIIYRVAQACNINPQVLIVMLQKEQGLITHTWPSAWRYNIALGQGCPDTAPCDPNFIGFFHQIYGAARQMQIYMEGKWFQWYAPGNTWNILYNPNAACGSGRVYVANKATAALYYYTPYQPNAAALRAGYGLGNSCSAYGNRNFYNYFTDWFGSTQAADPIFEINQLYTKLGGATGVLGAAGTKPSCSTSTTRCTWSYAKGVITWTRALGALTVYGDVYSTYVAQGGLGGKLGYPAVTPKAITDPNGDGVSQQFSKGWIHASTRGTFASSSTVMAAYSGAGWIRGTLGWPTAAESCASQKCVQTFAGGAIRYNTGAAAYVVPVVDDPKIKAVHDAQGGVSGGLGYPVAATQKVVDPNGNGAAQRFDGGWVHSSTAGAFASSSTIMTAYSKAGWVRGTLGWPTGPETCSGTICLQPFQKGALQYTKGAAAAPAAEVTNSAIRAVYQASGGATGPLGYPLNPSKAVTDKNGNGYVQQFAGGWIHSSAKGTYATSTQLMTLYSAAGWLRGSLGWPAAAEKCTDLGCSQVFAKGTLSAPSAGSDGAKIASAIRTLHESTGGNSGALGSPIAAVQHVTDPQGNGDAQRFAHGWIHSSAKGTFSSSTRIMSVYSATGWVRGSLGWPVGAESTVVDPHGNGVAQQFSGGWIHSSAKGSFSSSTRIMTAYSAAGWLRGALGWPIAAEKAVADKNGNGVAQQFAGGWIHSSASGSFSSSATVMKAYSAAGWLRGPLGWPTSAETCTAGACAQSFTGGVIRYQTGAAAITILTSQNASIHKAFQTAGGAAGFLGYPVAAVQSVTDKNGNGFAQKFDGGWIHSSNAGTFTSSTAIMELYSEAGWLRGSLGWPVGAETCASGTCMQAFAGGTIRITPTQEDVFLTTTNAAILKLYSSMGGAKSSLGHAASDVQKITDPNGDGFGQSFTGGWIHSSDRGTFASSTAMMKLYSARGWIRGDLGWPTSAETCTSGTCTQSFENGTLSYTK